ncbi:hypothetical protein D3C73_1066070 [compost metagenome]
MESVRLTKPIVVTIVIAIPMMDSHFAPNRSNSLPVIGIINPISSAPGSISSPDSRAVYPRALCKYRGSSIISAYMTMVTAILITVVRENMLYLNALRSRSGLFETNCLHVNKIKATTPTTIDRITSALDQPLLPALLKP